MCSRKNDLAATIEKKRKTTKKKLWKFDDNDKSFALKNGTWYMVH